MFGDCCGRYLEHHLKPKLAPLLISSKLTQGDRVVLVRSKANPDNLNIVVSLAMLILAAVQL